MLTRQPFPSSQSVTQGLNVSQIPTVPSWTSVSPSAECGLCLIGTFGGSPLTEAQTHLLAMTSSAVLGCGTQREPWVTSA